ncbi:MAG: hypothetical protein WA857_09420 [Candidatus Acidiferrum sp.]
MDEAAVQELIAVEPWDGRARAHNCLERIAIPLPAEIVAAETTAKIIVQLRLASRQPHEVLF